MQINQIDLQLYNCTITLSPGKVIANEIKKKFDQLALSEARKFRDSFYKQFSDLDDLYRNCDHVANQVRLRAMDEGMKFITAQGVYDLSEQGFFEQFLQQHDSWGDDFDVVGRQYEAILEETAELNAYRTARRKNRSMWVGYGSEKAVYAADSKNLMSNIGHGAFNLVAKGITSVANAIKKDEIFKQSSTIDLLVVAIYELVRAVQHATVDAINSRFENRVHDYSADETSRAKAIVENIQKGRIPAESVQPALIKALEFDPYNKDVYSLLLKQQGDSNSTLESVAEYFGITDVAENKKALFEVELKKHDLSTLAACHENLPKLNQYAESIGYQGFANQAQQIQQALVESAFKKKLASTNLTTLDACRSHIPMLESYAKEIGYLGFDKEIPAILNAAIHETFKQAVEVHDLSTPAACQQNIPKLEIIAKEIGFPDFQSWADRALGSSHDKLLKQAIDKKENKQTALLNKNSKTKVDLWLIIGFILSSFTSCGLYIRYQNETAIEAQRFRAEQEKLRESERIETERQRRIEVERLQQIEAERERQVEAERQQQIEAEAIRSKLEKIRLQEEIDMREAQKIADEQERISQQQKQLINGRYQLQANGVEVKDTKTGLVWQRCSVGQAWNGHTCSGTAKKVTFYQAEALTGSGWRVPSKEELVSLVDKSAGHPVIDAEVFPATPASFFWTSTQWNGSASGAWVVHFYDGVVLDGGRNSGNRVRLVR